MHQGVGSKVYGQDRYSRHRAVDGFYHYMIGKAKQDEPLFQS